MLVIHDQIDRSSLAVTGPLSAQSRLAEVITTMQQQWAGPPAAGPPTRTRVAFTGMRQIAHLFCM